MAKMHSRKRGKARSKRPATKATPGWIRYNAKEAEMLIIKLAKEGKGPSQIGIYLRDTYGIPYIKGITGKRLTKILEEKNISSKLPEDLMGLIKKSIKLKKHMGINKKDEAAKRGLLLTESKIKRLVKYYKRTRRLPEDWKFEPEKVRMYLE